MTKTRKSPSHQSKPGNAETPRPGVATIAECVRVIDGDTIVVSIRRTLAARAGETVDEGEIVTVFIPADSDGHVADLNSGEVYRATPDPLDGPATAESLPRPRCGLALRGIVTDVFRKSVQVEVSRTLNLRLLDCWAPESRTRDVTEKARGLASKAALQSICPPGTALCVFIPADAHGRISDVFTMGRALAWAWPNDTDPRDLSERQRDGGHAFATKPEENGRR